jgi:hypothetical protein
MGTSAPIRIWIGQTHDKLHLSRRNFKVTPLPTEPVHLIEDAATGDRILIYGTEKGVTLELRYEGDTLDDAATNS